MKTTPLLALLLLAAPALAAATDTPTTRPTARQIVDRIRHEVAVPWQTATVDTFKAGDPDTPVTGIVTTHLCTLDVLQRAAADGKNFVITHEPTFYGHLDQTAKLEGDPVFAAKKAFIEQHHMVVWRFHDHWHRRNPTAGGDGIYLGVNDRIGWTKFLRPGTNNEYDLPAAQTLRATAEELKKKTGATTVRVVGKADLRVTKVGAVLGAAGFDRQLKMIRRDDVEVLLIGEVPEWETVEYVRDANSAGIAKGLILLGHRNSEEPGMVTCAEWLKTFVPEVPITFLSSGDPVWPVE